MDFRDRLRKAMNDNNLNARELSKRCGLSEASISRYLLGQMEPKVDAVKKMADALHVDPVWLMGIDKEETRWDYSMKVGSMALLLENMTPSEQDQVDKYIKFLISLRGGDDA